MGKPDLSLVPLEDLLDEAEARCNSFIASWETYEDTKHNMKFKYGKGNWFEAVRLASILNNDVLNNWNGEMKTLQRIHEETQEQ